ncbi:MAG: helix-turn-helix domain-containing protein [Fretibacterium sp.]|nr:helix-turn-helix domain-containing protein [Fretibacterium sp.]
MISKEDLEKDYIDAGEAKKILGLSGSRMSRLCTGGRFPGAFKFGSIWIIPREAVKNHTKLRPGVKRGRPSQAKTEVPAAPQKRRGRPPKAKTAAAAAKKSAASALPKKRGRPKGSRNKTKKTK